MSARDHAFMTSIVGAHFGVPQRATQPEEQPARAEADPDERRDELYFDRLDSIARLLRLALDPADGVHAFDRVRQALNLAELGDVPLAVVRR